MNEVWIDVVGYENIYQISSLGRIKHLPRDIKRKPGRQKQHGNERISEGTLNKHGYKQFQLAKNGVFKKVSLHRIVALNFIPNPHNKPEVNHKDGDKTNNTLDNLEWATRSENLLHKHRVLLCPSGRKGKKNKPRPAKPIICNNGIIYDNTKHAADCLNIKSPALITQAIRSFNGRYGWRSANGPKLIFKFL